MRYRPEIDGLRAVAVLPVIFFHAGFPLFSGGFAGVDVFFVISGYLIGTIVLSEVAESRFSLMHFYERRARRIMPALFTVMLATMPFGWLWMFPDAFREYSRSLMSVPLFVSNVQFWLETGYFQLAAEEKPLLHTWSLAVEEQYYLLFPLLAMATYRHGRHIFVAVVILLFVASLFWAEYASHYHPEANFFLLMGRIWELLAGVLAALWLMYRGHELPRYGNFAALCGLGMIICAVVLFSSSTRFPSLYALLPVMGAVLVIVYAREGNMAGRLLALKPVVGIGLISYSVYLWHQPLFAFARIRSAAPPSALIFVGLTVLSFVLAALTYRYIETPFRRDKGSGRIWLTRRGVFMYTAVIGMAFITVGFICASGMVPARNSKVVDEVQALFRKNNEGRSDAIRLSKCHYNPQISGDLDAFLTRWNCDPYRNPIAGRQPVPIVIVGDSHAADKAASLRMNGFEPLQMGGAGCSINPATMTPYCRKSFDMLKEKLKGRTEYKELWLANRYLMRQMQVEHFESAFAYWSETGLHIRLFTPMPRFVDVQKKLMHQQVYGEGQAITADESVIKAFNRLSLGNALSHYGVTLVDTGHIYCSLTQDCDYKTSQGEMLLIDQDHLSAVGAKLFGAALVREGLVPAQKAFQPMR